MCKGSQVVDLASERPMEHLAGEGRSGVFSSLTAAVSLLSLDPLWEGWTVPYTPTGECPTMATSALLVNGGAISQLLPSPARLHHGRAAWGEESRAEGRIFFFYPIPSLPPPPHFCPAQLVLLGHEMHGSSSARVGTGDRGEFFRLGPKSPSHPYLKPLGNLSITSPLKI